MVDCIFCKIANKEIKANILLENEKTIAFYDIAPQAPKHILVIPKKHISSIVDVSDKDLDYIKEIFSSINDVVSKEGLNKSGFRVVLNHGQDAGQAVPHLHFHILGGRKLSWPPG